MTVLVCNDTPDAIRGMLKRWFIEPKPNVFVGTLNTRTHGKVMSYILRHASSDFGVIAMTSMPNSQGFKIERFGPEGSSGKRIGSISGLDLVIEKWRDEEKFPF